MRKHENSFVFHGESGFTLVEILVALVILLLVVTACFPLFTMATKITHENRARMIAAELAKRELEHILAQVTPSNYISEEDGAPLKTGISEYYFDDDGNPLLDENGSYSDTPDPDSRFALFEARKIVQWVDDPADGLFSDGDDKNPFDYKALTIEVSCPSLFTGKVTKKADFKTFVAREGSTSPISGVIIEVVRGWTDENGERIPVEGAIVTLDGTGPSHMAMTNADGQALIPMTFPDDNTVYSYQVQTERLGMITRPDQPATEVEARPYVTSYKQVEMEEPATLNLKFAPSQEKFDVTLDGVGESRVKTVAAGQSSVTFTDLWPAGVDPDPDSGRVCEGGTYSLTIEPLLAYPILPDLALPENGLKYPADEYPAEDEEPAILNLWDFKSNYNDDGPAWVASAAGNNINTDYPQHRLTFLKSGSTEPEIIDLTPYKPDSSDIDAELTVSFTEFVLSGYTNLTDDFTLVYLGDENAELNSDDTNDWAPYIKIGTDSVSGKWALLDGNNNTLKEETDDHEIIIPDPDHPDTKLELKYDYFYKTFKMRFDSSPDIGTFFFRRFNIYCSYNTGSIQFAEPGHNLTLKISGK
ncbi:MAG TPA: carboxypeptidase regulatory-like domain-containing protein [Gelria sp.]|jgi:prepilin-type N-terminal cleavage/methylation domain-containing protein|nr:carboxypeptidase regulatory-like domain-containing protein [Gelria sp.]